MLGFLWHLKKIIKKEGKTVKCADFRIIIPGYVLALDIEAL